MPPIRPTRSTRRRRAGGTPGACRQVTAGGSCVRVPEQDLERYLLNRAVHGSITTSGRERVVGSVGIRVAVAGGNVGKVPPRGSTVEPARAVALLERHGRREARPQCGHAPSEGLG